jgi:hypothetical protein
MLGLRLQVTEVSEAPPTVALNCWVCDPKSVTVGGVTFTVIGTSVSTELPVLAGSAALVAMTVTDCWELIAAGAVYNPVAEIEPTAGGLMVQVSDVFPVPVTVAVNCCVWPPKMFAVGGVTLTATGARLMVAEDDTELLKVLVAFAVIVWAVEMIAGAVYSPVVEIVPTLGVRLQVTLLEMPAALTENCCVCP